MVRASAVLSLLATAAGVLAKSGSPLLPGAYIIEYEDGHVSLLSRALRSRDGLRLLICGP